VDKILGYIPRALASHAHILFLLALGIYLIVLPILHVYTPSAKAMLIGGNYTNVTSDIGACIAAGGTIALLAHSRKRTRIEESTRKIMADLYRHHTGKDHPDAPAGEVHEK
jgi:hypothetical protein